MCCTACPWGWSVRWGRGVCRGAGRVQWRPGRLWSGGPGCVGKGGPMCGGTGAWRGVACRVGCRRGVWARMHVGRQFGVQWAGVCWNAVGALAVAAGALSAGRVHERGAVAHGCVGKGAQRVGVAGMCWSGPKHAEVSHGQAWTTASVGVGHVKGRMAGATGTRHTRYTGLRARRGRTCRMHRGMLGWPRGT